MPCITLTVQCSAAVRYLDNQTARQLGSQTDGDRDKTDRPLTRHHHNPRHSPPYLLHIFSPPQLATCQPKPNPKRTPIYYHRSTAVAQTSPSFSPFFCLPFFLLCRSPRPQATTYVGPLRHLRRSFLSGIGGAATRFPFHPPLFPIVRSSGPDAHTRRCRLQCVHRCRVEIVLGCM